MSSIICCPKCSQKLRVPNDHGVLNVTCTSCKHIWTWDSKVVTEEDFDKDFDKVYEEKRPKFEENLNIAIVGKVSAGKSSLLNAIFERDRKSPLANVGAESGITQKVAAYKLGKQMLIMDCPGLDDIRKETSQVTVDFMKHVDFGIFVVTGAADASQKEKFIDLKQHAKSVIVVLNKIDEWDSLKPAAYESVVAQWKATLGVDQIFGSCTVGFDPEMRDDAPMDIRGVDEIRSAIYDFLKVQGKEILFAREMQKKGKFAAGIIISALTALTAVAAEAFVPGSAAYITATQVVGITALHYLYTGEVMTKSSALSLLPQFIGRSLGMTAFLWIKSFLPPTGIVDVAAAGVAIVITFAMLAAVKWMLENNISLDQADKLGNAFSQFKSAGSAFADISWSDFKNPSRITEIVERLLKSNLAK